MRRGIYQRGNVYLGTPPLTTVIRGQGAELRKYKTEP